MGDGCAVFVIEIHRIKQLAVDNKLELVVGIVPNADGGGLLVALEMREDFFREDVPPVDAIHYLERPVWSERATAGLDPPHKGCGLVGIAQTNQRIEGERGVPDPGIAVIPVALPADFLGEAESRGSDQ